jgi:hypothetical protein
MRSLPWRIRMEDGGSYIVSAYEPLKLRDYVLRPEGMRMCSQGQALLIATAFKSGRETTQAALAHRR